jgi:transposase-like protein
MVDCPYCGSDVHVENENIRDEFEEQCASCNRKFKVFLNWNLFSEALPEGDKGS